MSWIKLLAPRLHSTETGDGRVMKAVFFSGGKCSWRLFSYLIMNTTMMMGMNVVRNFPGEAPASEWMDGCAAEEFPSPSFVVNIIISSFFSSLLNSRHHSLKGLAKVQRRVKSCKSLPLTRCASLSIWINAKAPALNFSNLESSLSLL